MVWMLRYREVTEESIKSCKPINDYIPTDFCHHYQSNVPLFPAMRDDLVKSIDRKRSVPCPEPSPILPSLPPSWPHIFR